MRDVVPGVDHMMRQIRKPIDKHIGKCLPLGTIPDPEVQVAESPTLYKGARPLKFGELGAAKQGGDLQNGLAY